mmetsp:Transcript_110070/g.224948  ORF Transcript_110070/g.224948 Transcript_110070/m.224948 type:complete len:108 (-) Transcript_110070:953-1276(-)
MAGSDKQQSIVRCVPCTAGAGNTGKKYMTTNTSTGTGTREKIMIIHYYYYFSILMNNDDRAIINNVIPDFEALPEKDISCCLRCLFQVSWCDEVVSLQELDCILCWS